MRPTRIDISASCGKTESLLETEGMAAAITLTMEQQVHTVPRGKVLRGGPMWNLQPGPGRQVKFHTLPGTRFSLVDLADDDMIVAGSPSDRPAVG